MISDGMTKEEIEILKRVGKIVMPIFEKALQETQSNQVRVGTTAKEKYDFSIIRPHNYRRWYDFNTSTFTPPTRIKNLKRRGINYKSINHNSEHFFENYMQCNIKVKKKTIEIQNKIENDRSYAIDIYRASEQVANIIQKKEYEIIKVLKTFIEEFGGTTTYNLLKHKEEIKIENNAITDKIAQPLTWHTQDHKKVYEKKLVELYDINKAIQLIDNSIFYKNAEQIAHPLKSLLYEVQKLGSKDSIPHPKELPSQDFNKPMNFEQLSKAINNIDDGIKYKNDILALPQEQNWELAKLLKQRIFGDPVSQIKKKVFGV